MRNEADSLIYNTEKSLNEHRSKLPQQDAEEIDRDLQELKEAINGQEPDKMRECIEKVKNAAMKIGKAMYANTGASADQGQQQEQTQEGEQNQNEQNQGEDQKKQ